MPTRLRRLHAPELPEQGGQLTLPPGSADHARVLRLSPGAAVELFDGKGAAAVATIVAVERERVVCRAEPRVSAKPPEPALHIVLGLPKGNKAEEIVRMLSELGVAGVHLALCERSVPRPDKFDARLVRLSRIALEACAQSGQPCAPVISEPRPLLQIAPHIPPHASRIVFWECADAPLSQVLGTATPSELWAVIGPEGGLSQPEVDTLSTQGFSRVGLGPALLRVDTAAVTATAMLLDRLGRLT